MRLLVFIYVLTSGVAALCSDRPRFQIDAGDAANGVVTTSELVPALVNAQTQQIRVSLVHGDIHCGCDRFFYTPTFWWVSLPEAQPGEQMTISLKAARQQHAGIFPPTNAYILTELSEHGHASCSRNSTLTLYCDNRRLFDTQPPAQVTAAIRVIRMAGDAPETEDVTTYALLIGLATFLIAIMIGYEM